MNVQWMYTIYGYYGCPLDIVYTGYSYSPLAANYDMHWISIQKTISTYYGNKLDRNAAKLTIK